MDVVVRSVVSPGTAPVEVVERKGRGHPDTLCDGIAEEISRALSRHYLERFGAVLHHNVDKVLLAAGQSRAELGGGELVAPLEITLAGRATRVWREEVIAVDEIARDACKAALARAVPNLEVDRWVEIRSRIGPGSSDLVHLFSEGHAVLANDTSSGTGFAPLTDVERVVQAVGRSLEDGTRAAVGPDVKVMAIRNRDRIELVVACALVARHVPDVASYVAVRDAVRDEVLRVAREATRLDVAAIVNAGDDIERGRMYLTVTGSSAEAGDDGEVGRGNRVSGLITPYRWTTMEAAAGKNPVTHVGKLYQVVARRIAERIVEDDADGASCMLVSRIGTPIDEPAIVDVGLEALRGRSIGALESDVQAIARDELGRLGGLQASLVAGEIDLF
jgi:S-adenosylmethionine synthetase